MREGDSLISLPCLVMMLQRQDSMKKKYTGVGGLDNLLSATPQGTQQMKRTSCSLEGKYESERKF